ncbi:MAG: hypothetical protein AVDCRST_MAG93-3618, partial [uncultured Chloroflexia bacterium]
QVRRKGFAAYRRRQLTKGHENQLGFDRYDASYDKVQKRGRLRSEVEEKYAKTSSESCRTTLLLHTLLTRMLKKMPKVMDDSNSEK